MPPLHPGAPGREVSPRAYPSTPAWHPAAPCCFPWSLQVRRLALALARAFYGPGSRHERVLEAALGDERRWSVDDRLLAAAQAVMGLAMVAGPQGGG